MILKFFSINEFNLEKSYQIGMKKIRSMNRFEKTILAITGGSHLSVHALMLALPSLIPIIRNEFNVVRLLIISESNLYVFK